MVAEINLKNPVQVRDAGLTALRNALGVEGTAVFIDLYKGHGDYTHEKYDAAVMPFDEITALVNAASDEIKARRYG